MAAAGCDPCFSFTEERSGGRQVHIDFRRGQFRPQGRDHAQMIGASRETVMRLFADFKKRNLLQFKGSSVSLKHKLGLEQLLQED
jgi:CRP-like cAMP-binding protein